MVYYTSTQMLDRFIADFEDLIEGDEHESDKTYREYPGAPLTGSLTLFKEECPGQGIFVRLYSICLAGNFEKQKVLTRLLDHMENHPLVAQVHVADLDKIARPWLNASLVKRGYQDQDTRCVKICRKPRLSFLSACWASLKRRTLAAFALASLRSGKPVGDC